MKLFTLRRSPSGAHSTHIAILRGLIRVALFVFLGKLVGAAKEMAIAYRYGVNEQVDAYLFLFNLISWPIAVWFGVVSYLLPPFAANLRENYLSELPRFRAELLGFTLLLGCNLTLAFWFGLPLLLHSSWVGLSPSTVAIAIDIIPEIVSLVPLGIVVSLLSVWMLSSGRHANTLFESIPALAILIGVLLLPQQGISPLLWGTIAGYGVHVLASNVSIGASERHGIAPVFISIFPVAFFLEGIWDFIDWVRCWRDQYYS